MSAPGFTAELGLAVHSDGDALVGRGAAAGNADRLVAVAAARG